jgi:hypothetical protein
MPKIKSMMELREHLLDAFEKLERDPRALNQCAELSNIAGKIIASVKVEHDIAVANGANKEAIEFITGQPLIPLKQLPAPKPPRATTDH